MFKAALIFAGGLVLFGDAFDGGVCRGPFLPCAGITDQLLCQSRPECRWMDFGIIESKGLFEDASL